MSVLVVDTSAWVAFFRGETLSTLEEALEEARVILPPIVLAELMSGARTHREEKWLSAMMTDLECHETPKAHWLEVGRLRHRLAAKGVSLSIPDAHVAQVTIETNGALLTFDRIFEKVASVIPLRLVK